MPILSYGVIMFCRTHAKVMATAAIGKSYEVEEFGVGWVQRGAKAGLTRTGVGTA